ncbi:FAD-dependent monooxygenase [Arthrobacter sp. CJ23]|uniref:FAD-dependent monooxygenase n=1 Tax=Arthrobacter sp. CJ23 TaxID=2972479 RepID=UPI00215B8767|nr:FAD-dependent monooxygenase [Arthrobacter sp. CJ23]UVJ38909.1 FAD-dependent monooxygenase [Arthrobacter sp. CJ23]
MKGSAVIIGAGIAGLAAGRALVAEGWDVAIHERLSGLSTAGTALGIWPDTYRALEELGVTEFLNETITTFSHFEIRNPEGRVLARPRVPGNLRGLRRKDLLAGLYAGLPNGTVVFDSAVAELHELPAADVVVVADGVHSAARKAVFPAARLRDLGTYALRGTLDFTPNSQSETWGRGRLFGFGGYAGGGTNWYAGLRSELAEVNGGGNLALLKEKYRGWHAGVLEVIDHITEDGIDRRHLEDLAPLRSYVSGKYVLVGDAAHAMAPNLGRGGCEALVDGLALAKALTAGRGVEEALSRYDAERRRPTQRIVAGSRLMNNIAAAENYLPVRTAALAMLGVAFRGSSED